MAVMGHFYILAKRLLARRGAVVPVAVQPSLFVETHTASMALSGGELLFATHPVGVLPLQLGQVVDGVPQALTFGQLHHHREQRRLGAAQIVAAVAIGHVPEAHDQVGTVIGDRAHQMAFPAGSQAQHGEVGVPVVVLAEAPTGDDIVMAQFEQRRPARMLTGITSEYRPQTIDMRDQVMLGTGLVALAGEHVAVEVIGHESAQIESWLVSLLLVGFHDLCGRLPWNTVGEGFGIMKDMGQSDCLEQLTVTVVRRDRRFIYRVSAFGRRLKTVKHAVSLRGARVSVKLKRRIIPHTAIADRRPLAERRRSCRRHPRRRGTRPRRPRLRADPAG